MQPVCLDPSPERHCCAGCTLWSEWYPLGCYSVRRWLLKIEETLQVLRALHQTLLGELTALPQT